jgi:serine O-acetyltransferase
MKYLNLVFYGVRIDERARIGGGLYIGHATSILIAENVTIGERFTLFHQNTIGVSPWNGPRRATGQVSIGNDVSFGGGACAYGDIVIGDGSSVGVNAVVDRSFPAKASLFGVPAKMVGELMSSKASAV